MLQTKIIVRYRTTARQVICLSHCDDIIERSCTVCENLCGCVCVFLCDASGELERCLCDRLQMMPIIRGTDDVSAVAVAVAVSVVLLYSCVWCNLRYPTIYSTHSLYAVRFLVSYCGCSRCDEWEITRYALGFTRLVVNTLPADMKVDDDFRYMQTCTMCRCYVVAIVYVDD